VSPEPPPRHFDAATLDALVPMGAAVDAVAEALTLAASGEVEQPRRLVLNDATSLVMTAVRRSTGETAVKAVSVFVGDDGPADRQPGIAGLFVWLDPRVGGVTFTADGARLTAIRTGAVSGLATRLLADPDAEQLCLLGSGRQAYTQATAVCAVRPIRRATVWSRTPAHAATMVSRLAVDLPGVEVTQAPSADEAVAGADVVCAATSSRTPLFSTESLSPHAHVNAVGAYRSSMAELPTDLLLTGSTVAVDDRDGCLHESGEVIAALDAGFAPERLLALHRVPDDLAARRSGRTVFKSVGCAALDFAVGNLLAGQARHDLDHDNRRDGHEHADRHHHRGGSPQRPATGGL